MHRTACVRTALVLLLLACRSADPRAAAGGAAPIVARVRAALGSPSGRLPNGRFAAVMVEAGSGQTVRYAFGEGGRLRRGDVGFDGELPWQISSRNRTADPLSQRNREKLLTPLWLLSGWLFAPDAPFVFDRNDAASTVDHLALNVRMKEGVLTSVLLVDRKSFLPAKLTIPYERGPFTAEYFDYGEQAGHRFPRRIVTQYRGDPAEQTLTRIETLSSDEEFAVPPLPDDHSFDAARDAQLAVLPGVPFGPGSPGHVYVNPVVNGSDAGWWNLDSGADAMLIDETLADALALPVIGTTRSTGADGRPREATIRKAATFTLGRITVRDVTFLASDLTASNAPAGKHRGGVVGSPIFARAVIELVRGGEGAALHDRRRYALPSHGRWYPLSHIDLTPAVCASFEGQRGVFQLDTGASGTLTFYGPYAERHKLLERPTRAVETSGSGGAFRTLVGTVKSFELAGQTFRDVEAAFRVEGFSREGGAGVIGRELMAPFTVVYDYPHQRVGFVRADGAPPPKQTAATRTWLQCIQ